MDTCFAEPPTSTLGIPGLTGADAWGIGGKGLADVDEEVIACLDERCRAEFEKAREEERGWKMSWGAEAGDGGRRKVIRRY